MMRRQGSSTLASQCGFVHAALRKQKVSRAFETAVVAAVVLLSLREDDAGEALMRGTRRGRKQKIREGKMRTIID